MMIEIRLGQPIAVGKPVIGAQNSTSKIFKKAAAKLIGAGASLHNYLRSGHTAKFWCVGAGQNLELLQCIYRE
jgi:hypothetical protein